MILEKLERCPMCGEKFSTQYAYDFQVCDNCDHIPSIEEIEASSFSTVQVAAMGKRIAELEAERDGAHARADYEAAENQRLREAVIKAGLHRQSPCVLCGYNGPEYYQPETHKCAALNGEVGDD